MTNSFILVFLKYKHQLIQIVSLASFAGISLFCSFHEAAVNTLRYAARYQRTLRNKMTRKTLLIISFLKQTTHVKYPFFYGYRSLFVLYKTILKTDLNYKEKKKSLDHLTEKTIVFVQGRKYMA